MPARVPQDLDRNIALDLVRVTEAAAMAAGRWVGRGDKEGGDGAAVDAMRKLINSIQMRGIVVIGEGEKDNAPMLFNGEQVGDGTGPEVDVAVDPVDGTTLMSKGMPNALAVLAVAERGAMFDPSAVFYMDKLAVGPDYADVIDINAGVKDNLRRIAKVKRGGVSDVTVCILDRPRHQKLIQEVRDAGARIHFISDGDIAGAISAARTESDVDVLMGVGGTPEGITAACALKCMGGMIQAKLWPLDDSEREKALAGGHDLDRVLATDDLVTGDNCFFVATGVTSGDLLKGVRYRSGGAFTQSIVMRSKSGTIRVIDSYHRLEKLALYSAIDFDPRSSGESADDESAAGGVTATIEAPVAVAPTSVRRRAVGVGLAVVSGVALAAQSRINGELAVRLHDAVAAAALSFGSGLVLLVVIVAALPPARRGLGTLRAALATGRIRRWQLLGGACGAFLVASQGLAVATLGVAVFIVALVAGQSVSGLVVDRLGAAPGGARPVTVPRLAGAVLTVLAVLLAVADRLAHPGALGLAVLPLVAGLAIAWQQAVNGHVRTASGSALVAGLVNFSVGTAVLLLAAAVTWAFRGLPGPPPAGDWWLYAGGPLGIVFIALGAAVVRHTGVLLLGLGMIAGQVTGALAIDLVAPPATGGPGWNTAAGAALTLLAVVAAALPAGIARRR